MRKLTSDKLLKAQGRQAYRMFQDDPLFVEAIEQLASQGATLEEAEHEYLRSLETHTGTARQFALAVVYVQSQQ